MVGSTLRRGHFLIAFAATPWKVSSIVSLPSTNNTTMVPTISPTKSPTISPITSPVISLQCPDVLPGSHQISSTVIFNYAVVTANPPGSTNDILCGEFIAHKVAWVAFGLTTNGFMVGSEAIIGLPNEGDVRKYNMNSRSVSGVVPMSDSRQTLQDTSIVQENGQTIMKFTKFLKEDGEIDITGDGENRFLYAVGFNNDLGFHLERGEFRVTLSNPSPVNSLQCPDILPGSYKLSSRERFNYAVVTANPPGSTNDILCGELISEQEAWVAFGLTNNGYMVGSEAIIGFPNNGDVRKYNMNSFSVSGVVPMSASRQTLQDASVVRENGLTIMKFTKFLKEDGEIDIIGDGENEFLYAVGSANDLGYHYRRGVFRVTLF